MVNITCLIDFWAKAMADLTLGKYFGPKMSETVDWKQITLAGMETRARVKTSNVAYEID